MIGIVFQWLVELGRLRAYYILTQYISLVGGNRSILLNGAVDQIVCEYATLPWKMIGLEEVHACLTEI